jgi:tol-pal system protein YbgF
MKETFAMRGAAMSRASGRALVALFVVGGVAGIAILPGCVAPGLIARQTSLDSLRVIVDTLRVRDSLAYRTLVDVRREVVEQRDILLSTRAASGTTTREMFDQMERLEVKLDEVMGRFQRVTERGGYGSGAGTASSTQLYDQAAEDLTQGRYEMALQGFQTLVREFPDADLSDNALYGVGECYFALAKFDSAGIAYARVESEYPQAEKVPAALFKLALSQDKEGKADESQKTLERLVERFPNSGEAQLARERLGTSRRR